MRRRLQITIGDADHDPMFKPVWTSGLDSLVPTPPPPSMPPPPLPPLPPPDPEALKWEAVLDRANAVTSVLKAEPDFDGTMLASVVMELLDSNPTAEAIIDAYHLRMETRRNG